jgi:hypothetical protein
MVIVNIRYYCINEFSWARVEGMKLSKNLIEQAIKGSAISGLSVSEQIEYWANIGSLVEENPDLPYAFIKAVLDSDRDTRLEEYRHS